MSGVTSQMSDVKCQVSPLACHMSLTVTPTAMDPPPANSPPYTQQDAAADLDLDPIMETLVLSNVSRTQST